MKKSKIDFKSQLFHLREKMPNVNIPLDDCQIDNIVQYLNFILEWNKRTNLVSRSDQVHLVERHVLESIAVLAMFDIARGAKIIDVGSGAGFPAFPVAIIRPDLEFLLVESKRMKSLFLNYVRDQLKLNNVGIICDRIENLNKNENWRYFFDIAFSRAVGKIVNIFEWVQPLMIDGGFIIAWKGGVVDQELAELNLKYDHLNVCVIEMDSRLVDPSKKRVLVKIEKIDCR